MELAAEAELLLPLVAVVATAIGGLVYVVRRLVASRPAPEEMVRTAILEVVRAVDRKVREMYAQVSALPKNATDCPWAQGRIPEHYERFARALITELENRRLQSEHQRGGGK